MDPLPLTSTYADARADFLDRARSAGADLHHDVAPVTGPDGGELAVDRAWLGPADADDVVLVVSGTHGVEGFAGSALQRTWLRDTDPGLPSGVGLCLVHALNPYGFAWVRRVNEDNVDLNRNFVDFSAPPANDGYDRIAELLVPDEWTEATQERTTAELFTLAGDAGFGPFQEWVSGGQYRHPLGIFHGGTAPVWSHRVLDDLCDTVLAGRRSVAIVDLHTGLGPWGVGELISSDAPDDPAYRRAVQWYGDDVTSLVAGDSVSAQLSGEWLPHVRRRLESGADDPATQVTAVALEYGTVDTVTVLQALRADAWLHGHGDPTGPDAPAIKAQLRAAFADDDPSWIAEIAERFRFVLDRTFAGLG